MRQQEHNALPKISASSWTYSHPDRLDETPYVNLIFDRYAIPITWLSVDEFSALTPAPSDVGRDEPFPLPFEAMHCAALQSAQERGVRVILTGEGGDETSMQGNMLYLQDWLRRFQWHALWQDFRGWTPEYRRAALKTIRHSLSSQWLRRLTGRSKTSVPAWIQTDFIVRQQLDSWLRNLEPRTRRDGFYFQQRGRHPLFLGGEGRCARYEIEWRHPFYDSRIVEFLVRIPQHIRFCGGRNKMLLRRAMNGIVPEEIRTREPKGVFGPLFQRGMKDQHVHRLKELFVDSHLAQAGIVNTPSIEASYDAYLQGNDAKLAKVPWFFFTEQWLRQGPLDKRDEVTPAIGAGISHSNQHPFTEDARHDK
jgi:asparagine synthetase B (glutamine-hydrolysing)